MEMEGNGVVERRKCTRIPTQQLQAWGEQEAAHPCRSQEVPRRKLSGVLFTFAASKSDQQRRN